MSVSGFDLTLKLGLYDSVYSAERMFFFKTWLIFEQITITSVAGLKGGSPLRFCLALKSIMFSLGNAQELSLDQRLKV